MEGEVIGAGPYRATKLVRRVANVKKAALYELITSHCNARNRVFVFYSISVPSQTIFNMLFKCFISHTCYVLIKDYRAITLRSRELTLSQ